MMAVMLAEGLLQGALAARSPRCRTGDPASFPQAGKNVFITMVIQSVLR